MPKLNLKVEGYSRNSVSSLWERHELNGTLHPVLSGNIDGFSINKITLNSFDSGLWFDKNDVAINAGEEISQADMDAGNIFINYDHSGSKILMLTAEGEGKYLIKLTVNSGF